MTEETFSEGSSSSSVVSDVPDQNRSAIEGNEHVNKQELAIESKLVIDDIKSMSTSNALVATNGHQDKIDSSNQKPSVDEPSSVPSSESTTTRRSQRARKPKKMEDDEVALVVQRKPPKRERSKAKKAFEGGGDNNEEESEDEDEDETPTEDPNLYCICQSRDDGTPMICCDECGEWYHGKCLKLTKKQIDSFKNKPFVCHVCTDAEGKEEHDKTNPLAPIKNDKKRERAKTKKSNRRAPPINNEVVKVEVEEEAEAAAKSIKSNEVPDVFAYVDNPIENLIGEEETARKKAKKEATIYFPADYKKKEVDPSLMKAPMLNGGVKIELKYLPTPVVVIPPLPSPPSKLLNVANDKTAMKTRRDLRASRDKEEIKKRRKLAPIALPALTSNTDKTMREKIVTSLINALKMPILTTDGSAKIEMTDADYEELAKEIEKELHAHCGSATSDDYKTQCRSLLFNLKDSSNPLKQRVFSGEVTPERLCKMSPEELASPEIAMKRKAIEMQAIESVVIKSEEEIIPESLRMNHQEDDKKDISSSSDTTDISSSETKPKSQSSFVEDSAKTNDWSSTSARPYSSSSNRTILQKDPPLSSSIEINDDYPLDIDVDVSGIQSPKQHNDTVAPTLSSVDKQLSPEEEYLNEDLANGWLNTVDGSHSTTPPPTSPPTNNLAATTKISPGKAGFIVPSRSIGTDKGPIIWRGSLEKNFGIAEFRLKGYHLSGFNISTLSSEDYSFPPPSNFGVLGRMDLSALSSYLKKLSFSSSGLRSVMLLEPDNIEGDPAENLSRYFAAFEYYSTRKRAAVINTHANPFIKEIFVVPVKGSQKLPDWIEDCQENSIDNKKDKLVCAFVLNKREIYFETESEKELPGGLQLPQDVAVESPQEMPPIKQQFVAGPNDAYDPLFEDNGMMSSPPQPAFNNAFLQQGAPAPFPLSQQLLDQLQTVANLTRTDAGINAMDGQFAPGQVMSNLAGGIPALNLQALSGLLNATGIRPAGPTNNQGMPSMQGQLPINQYNSPPMNNNQFFQPAQHQIQPTESYYQQPPPGGYQQPQQQMHQLGPQGSFQQMPSHQQQSQLPFHQSPPQFLDHTITSQVAQQIERGRAMLQQQQTQGPSQPHPQQQQQQHQHQQQQQQHHQQQQQHHQGQEHMHRAPSQHQGSHHDPHRGGRGSWRRDDRRHR